MSHANRYMKWSNVLMSCHALRGLKLTQMQRIMQRFHLSEIRLSKRFLCLVLTLSNHRNRIYSGRQKLPIFGSFWCLAPFSSSSNSTAISFKLVNCLDRARSNKILTGGNTLNFQIFIYKTNTTQRLCKMQSVLDKM